MNPCHTVVLCQVFLFLLPKSRATVFTYICYMRWLYGTYSALIFPSLEGLDLYFEKEMFWLEHIMGTFAGPLVLVACGRYGYADLRYFVADSFFGWESHIIYMRVSTHLTHNSADSDASLDRYLGQPELHAMPPQSRPLLPHHR